MAEKQNIYVYQKSRGKPEAICLGLCLFNVFGDIFKICLGLSCKKNPQILGPLIVHCPHNGPSVYLIQHLSNFWGAQKKYIVNIYSLQLWSWGWICPCVFQNETDAVLLIWNNSQTWDAWPALTSTKGQRWKGPQMAGDSQPGQRGQSADISQSSNRKWGYMSLKHRSAKIWMPFQLMQWYSHNMSLLCTTSFSPV